MIDAFARFWELITRGGWLMWPILGCSVVALAVIIERALSYRRARVETRSLLDRILRLVQESRHSEAVELLSARQWARAPWRLTRAEGPSQSDSCTQPEGLSCPLRATGFGLIV